MAQETNIVKLSGHKDKGERNMEKDKGQRKIV